MSASSFSRPTSGNPPLPQDKAIAIAGPSNSGKTTLICSLLKWFSGLKLKVAVLKHSHRQHLGDEGKDTWRYRQAGGQIVALAAPGLLQTNRSFSEEPDLAAVLAELAPAADLILVEGYKTSSLHKIGVIGESVPSALPDYPHVLAWVSPSPLATDLPVFHPDQVEQIGGFILDQLKLR